MQMAFVTRGDAAGCADAMRDEPRLQSRACELVRSLASSAHPDIARVKTTAMLAIASTLSFSFLAGGSVPHMQQRVAHPQISMATATKVRATARSPRQG